VHARFSPLADKRVFEKNGNVERTLDINWIDRGVAMRHRSAAMKVRFAAAMLLAVAMLATACSSGKASGDSARNASSNSADAGVAAATETVNSVVAPVSFTGPGQPFQVGTQLNGKTFYFISAALSYQFTQLILSGMQAAAGKVGLKVVALDAKGDATVANRQIEQAISLKVAGIAIANFPYSVVAAPIKAAKAAGIPVFDLFDGDPGLPSAEAAATGVVANVTFCYSCAGKQLAAMAVTQSKGNVHAALINSPDVTPATIEADSFKSELAKLCSRCNVKEYGVPLAQWVTQLPSVATSAVQDPKVNFIVPVFSGMGDIMQPSLLAANVQGRVSELSYSSTTPSLQALQKKQLVTGVLDAPEVWMGWAVMDQVFRVLTGHAPVPSENVPNRAFTATNVSDANPEAPNYGTADFQGGYLKLWGLG
jgi:ribose transport system substrate-binding protein